MPTSNTHSHTATSPIKIIGLGWMGLPLAQYLVNHKYRVSGTVSSCEKANFLTEKSSEKEHQWLNELSIQTFKLRSDPVSALDFSPDSKLVLNIPPGRKNFDRSFYQSEMISLIDFAFSSGIAQLIFISTTSVFNGHLGSITNQTNTLPTTESGFAHQAIEQHIMSSYANSASIIRPSGLVGPNSPLSIKPLSRNYRHPVFSICKRENIANGLDPVNLIHRDDLIQVVAHCLQHKVTGRQLNLAAFENPSRFAYYTWCAEQLGLPKPDFCEDDLNNQARSGKTILGKASFEELGLDALYPSPFDILP